MMQKSRMLQIQGDKGEAVVLSTANPWQRRRCGILGFPGRVNNTPNFLVLRISLWVVSTRKRNLGVTYCYYYQYYNIGALFMQPGGKSSKEVLSLLPLGLITDSNAFRRKVFLNEEAGHVCPDSSQCRGLHFSKRLH